jgi:hypothetical protein
MQIKGQEQCVITIIHAFCYEALPLYRNTTANHSRVGIIGLLIITHAGGHQYVGRMSISSVLQDQKLLAVSCLGDVGTSHMSDNPQMSVAMQRLVDCRSCRG